MGILLWLCIGLLAGVSTRTMATTKETRLALDLAIGLVTSLAAGAAFFLAK